MYSCCWHCLGNVILIHGHGAFRSSWHRLTNSHSHARASAPRAAETHEFTLSRLWVRPSRCTDSRIHTLTLVCPILALHRLTNSHSHARAPDPRSAASLIHFVTLACPTRAAQIRGCTLSCLRARPVSACPPRTHALTFSRWRARAAWIQDYSSIQGFTFPVSYVWPSQIHREPAFLVSSRGEPASLLDFMACMVALSVLCCQRDFSYVRLWISLSWQAISCLLCQRTLRVAPRCLWTSSQPKMTEGSWGSCPCWRCWHCFGRVSQGLRQALLSQC